MAIQGPNGEITLAENLRRHAKATPNKPAVTCGERSLSYSELDKTSNRLARAFLARGIKQGDYVTLALPNSIQLVQMMQACWKIGATPQPVSFRLPTAELNDIVTLAKSPVVIGEKHLEAKVPVLDVDELIASVADDSDLPDALSPSWKAPTSGGSTGRPKLIVSTAQSYANPTSANDYWMITPKDVVMIPAPLYHNGPFICGAMIIVQGGHLVLTPRFDAEETLRHIDKYKVSWIYFVPTMMNRIWRLPDEVKAKYDVSSLKHVIHLAAPCPAWLKDAWIEWLGSEVIWEIYGGTEGTASTKLSGTEWLAHRGSVGKPASGEVKIVGPNGETLLPRETGDVYLKYAAEVGRTYFYIGAESKPIAGDWETIGDIGWVDEDGYLYLADRRTDMILVGGANVYPAEVESALDEHPLVQSSCVIGFPDDDMGNKIHAIVQPKAGLTEEMLHKHLAEKLVTYKRPRTFEFIDEPLRDDAGKVRRPALRAERLEKMGKG
jgi:bile acid-coenzyme A ligase